MNEIEVQKFWTSYRNNVLVFGQRKGQAMMNALRVVAPELYDEITGTDKDIFHRDTSQDIFRFREYLCI